MSKKGIEMRGKRAEYSIEKDKEIAKAKSISLLENITKFYTQKFQRFLTGIFAFGFLF